MPFPWAVALHGGAGNISKSLDYATWQPYENSLRTILSIAVAALEPKDGREAMTAVDVAELVVCALEDNPLFNAGKGSVLNHEGIVEMEASIMACERKPSGNSSQEVKKIEGPISMVTCGAVSGLTTVVHPISLARLVMEKTPHVYLGFEGAEAFATQHGVERQPNEWFIMESRRKQWEDAQKHKRIQVDHTFKNKDKTEETPEKRQTNIPATETVGCVVVDSFGQCCAATSTGGLTNKMVGRIGDTPIIGAGNYANNICAISATGVGEYIIKASVGRNVAAVMEYKGLRLKDSVKFVMEMTPKDTCGLIAVSNEGDVCMEFNTVGMFRACSKKGSDWEVAIW